jgi:hypothetical protein
MKIFLTDNTFKNRVVASISMGRVTNLTTLTEISGCESIWLKPGEDTHNNFSSSKTHSNGDL